MWHTATHTWGVHVRSQLWANYEGFNHPDWAQGKAMDQVGSVWDHSCVYLAQYGKVLDTTSDFMNVGGSFDIMLDCQAFISVSNCLDVGGQKIPVIVTSWKPTSWKCDKTDYIAFSCLEKKYSRVPAPLDHWLRLNSAAPAMGMPTAKIGVVKLLVWSLFGALISQHNFTCHLCKHGEGKGGMAGHWYDRGKC